MADDDEGPALQVRRTRNPDTPRASDGLSGNPFGAPADNPFATKPATGPAAHNPFASPSAGHQAAPNPFASPSVGHQAAHNPLATPVGQPASNPFATPAGQPASNPFATSPSLNSASESSIPFQPSPSGQTPNPFAAPPAGADAPLELDRDPGEFKSSTGAHKAELDEWNRSLQTGEFNIAGDPVTNPGADRSKVITGEMSRQEVAGLKEQAFAPPPTTGPGASGPRNASRPPHAAAAESDGGGNKRIPMLLGGVVLLAVAALGGKVAYTKLSKPKRSAVAEHRMESETDAFVRQMQAKGENAPDCWTSDDGYSFVYKDEAGEHVRVDAIADVPVLYRKASVCVPD